MALPEKLRNEIKEIQKRRHEISTRKLAFTVGLLGVGSLTIKIGQESSLDLTALLFVVPLVAIGFDIHILAEEYREKRIGVFLQSQSSGASEEEQAWESFAQSTTNWVANMSFWFVTMVILSGAALILYQTNVTKTFFIPWLLFVISSDTVLAVIGISLRKWFQKKGQNNRETTDANGSPAHPNCSQ